MAVFNIHEAKTQFSRLVDEAAAGREVVIAKAGKPIAKLVPVQVDATGKKTPRKLGIFADKYSFPEDFYDPLPASVLADSKLRCLIQPENFRKSVLRMQGMLRPNCLGRTANVRCGCACPVSFSTPTS